MESLRANKTGRSGESAEAGYGDGDAECERVQGGTWGVVEEDCEPEWEWEQLLNFKLGHRGGSSVPSDWNPG